MQIGQFLTVPMSTTTTRQPKARVALLLPEDLAMELRLTSAKTRRSQSKIVARALAEYLEKPAADG